MTIKAVLRPRKNEAEKPIYIRITSRSKVRYISTGLKIKPKYFNKADGKVRHNDYYDFVEMNRIIDLMIRKAQDERYALMAKEKPVNAHVLKQRLTKGTGGDFLAFWDTFIDSKDNEWTKKRYRSVKKKVSVFCSGDCRFSDIDRTWLKNLLAFLKKRGDNPTTQNSALRAVRAVLYEAIRDGYYEQKDNPFFGFDIPKPNTGKIRLTTKELKALRDAKLKPGIWAWHARNLFMFCFFESGMRFSDVVQLKKEDISNGYYRMSKTGKTKQLFLVEETRRILDLYEVKKKKPNDFVFPILNTDKNLKDPVKLVNEISRKNALVNKFLKDAATAAGIDKKISMHTARHSYSDFARRSGMNLYDLSKSLGHSSLSVTQTYLDELGDPKRANDDLFEGF